VAGPTGGEIEEVEGIDGVVGRHWHRLDDGRVQCDVCPRFCRLREGQRGLCFVRAGHEGRVVLTSYGRSSGYCVDPIEKKPLNHFLPGTPVLSFGTAGCNLTCAFCQNWEISKSREVDTLSDAAPPGAIARAALELGCRSVAFTYNDPVIFLEYAVDTARACREVGVRSVAVTAGYICDAARRDFFSEMDAANVDLKSFDDAFYRKTCSGGLQAVLDTLLYLERETDVWYEITTLLIPGANDSTTEIERAAAWIARELGPHVPWHFSAFHPDHRMRDVAATPLDTLRRAKQIAESHGLRYVYIGNVRDEAGSTTCCHACGARTIVRDGYALGEWNLSDDGECRECGTRCAGVFDGPPGDWGNQRLPIRLADFAAQSATHPE